MIIYASLTMWKMLLRKFKKKNKLCTAEKIDIAKTNTSQNHYNKRSSGHDCREEEQRPAKRVKVTAAASSVPVKSIVASYVPVSTTNVTSIGDIIPPPPPPLAYNNLKTTAQPQQQPPLPQNPNAQIDTSIKPHQLDMEALSDNIKLIPTTSSRGGEDMLSIGTQHHSPLISPSILLIWV